MRLKAGLTSLFLAVATGSWHTHALPRESAGDNTLSPLHVDAAIPFQLRILPLGASITRGEQSNPKDGYRKSLRDKIYSRGYVNINFVGTQDNDHDNPPGSMRNGAHEGHSGAIISEVNDNLNAALKFKPNFILINAGTNDCKRDIDIDNAHNRLHDICNKIWNDEGQSSAVIVLSTILPNADIDANANARLVNNNIRELVHNLYEAGKNIFLADMEDFITLEDLADGTHPTNAGYQKMAAVWWDAMSRALDGDRRLLEAQKTAYSDHSSGSGSTTCDKKFGSGKGPIDTQVGSGDDDGPYVHHSQDVGVLWSFKETDKLYPDSDKGDAYVSGMSFAQLINRFGNPTRSGSLDEFVVYLDHEFTGTDSPHITVYTNLDNGKFDDGQSIDVNDGKGCLTRGLHWGDVNNDGLDDYICIDPSGVMYVSINQGGNPPKFAASKEFYVPPSGTKQDHVLLADIDGDGRVDYCTTADNGDITCHRNGGLAKDAAAWLSLGVVFTGKNKGDLHGTRFVDINGDFRSDWVWLDTTGKSDIYTNQRNSGKGLAPYWRHASATHPGMGVAGARERIRFGKVYANTGASYAYITTDIQVGIPGAANYHTHNVHVYKNQGTGGKMVRGDGNRYSKVMGSKRDDYIWVGPNGELRIYENINSPPNWGQPDLTKTAKMNKPRQGIDFARWYSKDSASVVYADSNAQISIARHSSDTDRRAFDQFSSLFFSQIECNDSWGLSPLDRGIRFADINGDGYDDILCVRADGQTTGWLNVDAGKTVRNVGQVKKPEGGERIDVRWADVNGDGRADYILLDKLTGDAKVWYNRGEASPPVSGSNFKFDLAGVVYEGAARSTNLYFPDLDGDGRADMHVVDPVKNSAQTWYNTCAGTGTGTGAGDGRNDDDMRSDLPPAFTPQRDDTEAVEPPSDIEQPSIVGPPIPYIYPTWVAMGDSYSAGVGAGKPFQNPRDPKSYCFTTTGSYPKNLESNNTGLNGKLDFLSCSGDTIDHVYGDPNNDFQDQHGRESQYQVYKKIDPTTYNFTTLSIGGNDLGFGEIVKKCLLVGLFQSTCDKVLENAERLAGVNDPDNQDTTALADKLHNLYYDVILKSADARAILVVTGYAAFFSTVNSDCDRFSMHILSGIGKVKDLTFHKLKLQLRQRINAGVRAFNDLIKRQVSRTNEELQREGSSKRVVFVDIDPLFEGHRFCEPTDRYLKVNARDSWFFLPRGGDKGPNHTELKARTDDPDKTMDFTKRDDAFCNDPYNSWDCDLGELFDSFPNPTDDEINRDLYTREVAIKNVARSSKSQYMKTFHPKAIAYDAISREIRNEFQKWVA